MCARVAYFFKVNVFFLFRKRKKRYIEKRWEYMRIWCIEKQSNATASMHNFIFLKYWEINCVVCCYILLLCWHSPWFDSDLACKIVRSEADKLHRNNQFKSISERLILSIRAIVCFPKKKFLLFLASSCSLKLIKLSYLQQPQQQQKKHLKAKCRLFSDLHNNFCDGMAHCLRTLNII